MKKCNLSIELKKFLTNIRTEKHFHMTKQGFPDKFADEQTLSHDEVCLQQQQKTLWEFSKKACNECYKNSNHNYDEEMPTHTEDDYDADDEIPDKNEG